MTPIVLRVLLTKDEDAFKFEEQHPPPDNILETHSGLQDHGLRLQDSLAKILPLGCLVFSHRTRCKLRQILSSSELGGCAAHRNRWEESH